MRTAATAPRGDARRVRCTQARTRRTGAVVAACCAFALLSASTAAPRTTDAPEQGLAAPPPGAPADPDEALYLERFRALANAARTGLGLETYEPMEAVPGASDHRWLPAAEPGRGSIAPEALEAAREWAQRTNSSALLVWRAGRVEAAHYFGGRTRDDGIVSRSLAKPLTAIVVGRALALGALRSLDQPVADFVAEWRGDPRRSRILVRHLLDMRSGFLPQGFETSPDHVLNRAYLHPRHDEIIVREYPVVDEPGTRYEYNNATSEMVAVLIERATGRRYAEFVSTEVLQPLGALGGEVWINRPGGVAHSGCCIVLPPDTWLRLGILLLQDGEWEGRRLLPKGYVREMTTGTPQYPYYGLGVYVAGTYRERRGWANPERTALGRGVLHSEPYLARDLYLFDGNAHQVVYVVPSARLVIVRTGDAPPRGGPLEWDNARLPNAILRGVRWQRGERRPEPQPR